METMQCMEVWGGNGVVDSGVIMAGLDAWIFSCPYGQSDSGGDVYYVSSCATGRITRLLVADVSGHGAEVSEVATNLRRLMRRFINYIDQTTFVKEMNAQFNALSRTGRFATALVTTFFAPTNELSLCNAGHPPPLHYAARSGTWSMLESTGHDPKSLANIPLGILDLGDYDQFGVRLGVGDLVMCYTDSLIESKNRDGSRLEVSGLLDVVRGVQVTNPSQFTHALLEAIAALHAGNLDAADDVTVLLFRPNGLAPGVPLKDRVLAPRRIIKAFGKSLVSGEGGAPWPEIGLTSIGGAMLNRFNRRSGISRDR